MVYLKIIRPINLLVIALTQAAIYAFIIYPTLDLVNHVHTQDLFIVTMIIITTILLAAGGYVVNDILDVEADQINKPDICFIPEEMARSTAWLYYFSLNVGALILASLLSLFLDNYLCIVVYLISALLLYLYSKLLKHQVLTGNIIVALFCAFVPFILGLTFLDELFIIKQQFPEAVYRVKILMFFYVIFAFYTTFIRELIKDVEDFEGDLKANSKTLATVYGIQRSTTFCIFHVTVLLILVASFLGYMLLILTDLLAFISGMIIIFLPTFYILLILFKASSSYAKKASQLLKGLMLLGLLYMVIISL